MLKHTLGAEWWIVPTHKWHPSFAYLIGTPHFCVVLYRPGGKEWTSPIPEEAEAVAKLLSEAPAMYEALKALAHPDGLSSANIRVNLANAREVLNRLESK